MDIYQLLDDLNIQYEKYEHDAVFNCDEADDLRLEIDGISTKNLFLRDRKGKRHFLLVIQSDKSLDLKSLSEVLGVKALSFASAERLDKHLSTTPGSVSILDILKDSDGVVDLVLDEAVANSQSLQCHPYTNTATLNISLEDIQKLLKHFNREFMTIAL